MAKRDVSRIEKHMKKTAKASVTTPELTDDDDQYDEPYHEYHARSDLEDHSSDDERLGTKAASKKSRRLWK